MSEEMQEEVEYTLTRTQVTANYEPDKTTEKQWEAVRDECASGGALDERCNIVAASLGTGQLEVVSKRLACGCVLVRVDVEDSII